LGAAKSADLEVRWPSGVRESIGTVGADRLVTIREGQGIAKTEAMEPAARRGR
jgi:hypothetical protein